MRGAFNKQAIKGKYGFYESKCDRSVRRTELSKVSSKLINRSWQNVTATDAPLNTWHHGSARDTKRKRATCTRVPASQSISMLTVIVTHEPNLRSNINMDNTRGGDQR